jgi:hypothetical protein
MLLLRFDGVRAAAIEIRFSSISMDLTHAAQPPLVHAS